MRRSLVALVLALFCAVAPAQILQPIVAGGFNAGGAGFTKFTRPWFQAAGTAQNATTGTVTVAWPTHVTNDIGFLACETATEATTLDTANGFAAVTNSPQNDTTTQLNLYWARATSSSMASPVISHSSGDHIYCRIITFRGVQTSGNPWEATPLGGVKSPATTTTTFDAITTGSPNEHILNIATRDTDSTAAAWSAWTNSGLVTAVNCGTGVTVTTPCERIDGGTTSGNGGGIGAGSAVLVAAGSSGATTATVSSSADGHMTVALRGVGVTNQAVYDASTQLTACSSACTSVTGTHTPVASPPTNAAVVVTGTGGGTWSITSVTYDGVGMTQEVLQSSTDTFSDKIAIYNSNGLTLPSGAKTVTVNVTGTPDALRARVFTFTGGSTTTTFSGHASAISGQPSSVTCTSTPGEIVLEGIAVFQVSSGTLVGAASTTSGPPDAKYNVGIDGNTMGTSWMEGATSVVPAWDGITVGGAGETTVACASVKAGP